MNRGGGRGGDERHEIVYVETPVDFRERRGGVRGRRTKFKTTRTASATAVKKAKKKEHCRVKLAGLCSAARLREAWGESASATADRQSKSATRANPKAVQRKKTSRKYELVAGDKRRLAEVSNAATQRWTVMENN